MFTAKKCHILTKCDKFDKRWNIRRWAGESVPTGSIDRNFVRLVPAVRYWIFLPHFFARNLNSCKSYKLLFSQTQYIMQQQRRKKGAKMILIIETGYDGSLSTGLSRQIIWCRLTETVEWWKRRQRCFWAPRAWISQNLVFFSVLKMFWKYKLIFLSAWPSRLACSLDGCFDAQPKRLRGLT